MNAMIELLRDYEAQLPDAPPSKEDFMAAVNSLRTDRNSLNQDHFYVCFKMAQVVAVELIHFDVPEACEAAEGFRSRIKQKWQGGGEVDAYLKALDSEFKHAYADVKQGIMPWQERQFSE